MGLDTVHLLMAFEDYFGIHIDDLDAEKVVTIQDLVDLLARMLNVNGEEAALRERVRSRLEDALVEMGIVQREELGKDFSLDLGTVLDAAARQDLQDRLQLQLPRPLRKAEEGGAFGKWLDRHVWRQGRSNPHLSLDQWATWLCIANCKTLLHPSVFADKFEIYVGIAAVTVDVLGVDVYELEPQASFANDLGMD